MTNRVLLMALFATSPLAFAESDADHQRDLQRQVADAYSQCAAYYEIAASVRDQIGSSGVDDARAMKTESMTMAVGIATESEGKQKAKEFADAGFASAIEDMHKRIQDDPDAFRDWAEDQRRDCRMAINDPTTFVNRTLAARTGGQRNRRYITVPKDLTVEKILKHGKPATEFPDITKCTAPGRDVTVALDNVLVEGGMVCAQHQAGACAGERLWMSYRQYIESLYPHHEFNGYSQTYSLSFKNGERQEKRTLIACLVLPETST